MHETKKPHIVNNSGNFEWYTPEKYINSARRVMGSIDLDPASNAIANETVKAPTYYDIETNGLTQVWYGNVWLNPPYSDMKNFAKKVEMREFEQAIVLVNNCTETRWFRTLIDVASAIVFTTGRIKFTAPNRKSSAAMQGQAFFYIGSNPDGFLDEFQQYGWGVVL